MNNNTTAVNTKELSDFIKLEAAKKLVVPFVSEVQEFNEIVNRPNNFKPVIPQNREDFMFIYNFVKEEVEEYRLACEQGDIVGVLDALCDLAYVAVGNLAMMHGLKDKLPQAYAEVHASNMSKVCKTMDEAIATIEAESKRVGEPCHYEQSGEYYIVYRTRDRKVLKSINYFKPNLSKFFTDEELNIVQ